MIVQHRADLGHGHLEQRPFRKIGRPHGYVLALFDAECQEPLRQPIGFFAILVIGKAEIQAQFGIVVDQRFLGGNRRRLLIEEIADRCIQEIDPIGLCFPDRMIVAYSHIR